MASELSVPAAIVGSRPVHPLPRSLLDSRQILDSPCLSVVFLTITVFVALLSGLPSCFPFSRKDDRRLRFLHSPKRPRRRASRR